MSGFLVLSARPVYYNTATGQSKFCYPV